jgi:hypothetical protein
MCASQLMRVFLGKKCIADPLKCLEANAVAMSLEKGKEKK